MSKTVHQFECRDDVWNRVEALASRRKVTTDEIIQAALIQLFTRKKPDDSAADTGGGTGPEPAPAPAPSPRASMSAPSAPTPAPRPAPAARPGPPPPRSAPSRPEPSAPVGLARSSSAGLPRPGGGGAPPARLPQPGSRPSPSSSTPAPTPAVAPRGNRPLYLFFEGNWYTVDKDEFIIGRGSKFSDLPIKDANISRRHCAIMRRDGEYYMTDLGSTNGIEFAGQRVDHHRVEDGTVYYLCDHEIRFSFSPPY